MLMPHPTQIRQLLCPILPQPPVPWASVLHDKDIPGAELADSCATYRIRCTTKVNISMVSRDNIYPVDPLDAIFIYKGNMTCIDNVRYLNGALPVGFILGSWSLRNLYTLFHWGNWTPARHKHPLCIATFYQAWADFDILNFRRLERLPGEWIR